MRAEAGGAAVEAALQPDHRADDERAENARDDDAVVAGDERPELRAHVGSSPVTRLSSQSCQGATSTALRTRIAPSIRWGLKRPGAAEFRSGCAAVLYCGVGAGVVVAPLSPGACTCGTGIGVVG